MTTDCQLPIFAHLNFATLFSLSETNKYLSALARDVLKRRFAEKTLTISMPYYFGRTEYNVIETDNKMSTHTNVMLMRCSSTLLINKYALQKTLCSKRTVRRTHLQQRTNDVWQMYLKRRFVLSHSTWVYCTQYEQALTLKRRFKWMCAPINVLAIVCSEIEKRIS